MRTFRLDGQTIATSNSCNYHHLLHHMLDAYRFFLFIYLYGFVYIQTEFSWVWISGRTMIVTARLVVFGY